MDTPPPSRSASLPVVALVALGVAVAVVLGVFYVAAPRATRVKVGQQAPELELPFVDGPGRLRLSEYRPQAAALLVYFDVSCAECPNVMDGVERLQRRYNRDGLVIVAVSLDRSREAAAAFARFHRLTVLIAHDPGGEKSAPAWGSVGPLDAYLIDPKGIVQAAWTDPRRWFDPELHRTVQRVLPPSTTSW